MEDTSDTLQPERMDVRSFTHHHLPLWAFWMVDLHFVVLQSSCSHLDKVYFLSIGNAVSENHETILIVTYKMVSVMSFIE